MICLRAARPEGRPSKETPVNLSLGGKGNTAREELFLFQGWRDGCGPFQVGVVLTLGRAEREREGRLVLWVRRGWRWRAGVGSFLGGSHGGAGPEKQRALGKPKFAKWVYPGHTHTLPKQSRGSVPEYPHSWTPMGVVKKVSFLSSSMPT